MVGDLDRFAALSDVGQVTAGVLSQFPHPIRSMCFAV
jgi:hypothetical protein